MAIKSTIFKADLDISDMDRNYYESHSLTLARHSSETDERMMVRLLAFAIHAHEHLAFTEGLSNAEEPALWQKDLTGAIELWIEVGQPDEKKLLKACGRAEQVVVYCYAGSAPIWWNAVSPKLERVNNLKVVHVLGALELGRRVQRNLRFLCMIQDGHLSVIDGEETVEVRMETLREPT
jgi:uncharacterized protein YaeQ